MVQALSEESLKGLGLVWGIALHSLWVVARRKLEDHPEVVDELCPFRKGTLELVSKVLYRNGHVVEALAFEHWFKPTENAENEIVIPFMARKMAAFVFCEQELPDDPDEIITLGQFTAEMASRLAWLEEHDFLTSDEVKEMLIEFLQSEGGNYSMLMEGVDLQSWLSKGAVV